ncbi:ATP-dependent nuclease [Flagellimonas sp. 2504JD4-2]
MIKNIKLQFGAHPDSSNLLVETTPVTVFVGPNNSGKSKLLSEINQLCTEGSIQHNFKLIEDLTFVPIKIEELSKEIQAHLVEPKTSDRLIEGYVLFGDGIRNFQLQNQIPALILSDPNKHKTDFCKYYLRLKTLKLDALNRISLVNQQESGDLQQAPRNNLAILFKQDKKRLEARRIIYDAFKFYFVIDPTLIGKLRIRLSKVKPKNHQQERGLHKEAVEFHKKALEIQNASDGVKAFTGIITSIIAGSPKVTILDEPEAFLHPSLSYKLGKEISNSVKNKPNRLFVSTHSSNFLMGCIQSGSPVNIVRLTYSNEIGTARLLNKDKIESLMKDPLLKSIGVLNALFYKTVIVTEGDSDRVFYQEINERLSEFETENSIDNCLIINAVGKDTIHKIIKPLREMGIPAVGIYDIDILKNEGSNWTNALKSSFIPEISRTPLGQARTLLKSKFVELGLDMKKDGGVNALPSEEQEAANNLFDQLEEYGIFTVRIGEVENWLSDLNIEANKTNWISKVFEKMGANSDSPEYVKPGDDDVWGFMKRISLWMKDEQRKGIPK